MASSVASLVNLVLSIPRELMTSAFVKHPLHKGRWIGRSHVWSAHGWDGKDENSWPSMENRGRLPGPVLISPYPCGGSLSPHKSRLELGEIASLLRPPVSQEGRQR